MTYAGRRIEIEGVVQGVGFRPWVYRLAREEGLTGRVRNDAAGVTIEAFGPDLCLETFVQRLESSPPPAAAIRQIRWRSIPPEETSSFVIVSSDGGAERRVSIPPDMATCSRCEAEIFDPKDRRYRYPFTNCTDCGPRFTIVREVPYDRPATTMAGFQMCSACRREYDDPGDRRFHAQPNACPECGPRLELVEADGQRVAGADPLAAAAGALREGRIVAVKGLGGFHLACDATSSPAVGCLRQRKRREEKPFAVMVQDLEAAEDLAWIGEEERRLLTSVERPIVLVEGRSDSPLAPEVAPRNILLGLLLPYTPLHHLLLEETGRPLVMTSGNLSEEPIAYGNGEALARLGGIADLFLLHDREIESRCDDSVARVMAGQPVLLRRSRGYVPRPLALPQPLERPVLACGGHLKNTFCIAWGDTAFLGPHVGDLETVESYEAYQEAVARMERFLGVRPEVIAYDLHPGYLSTRYARGRAEGHKVAVQHHHAHVASAMAEHGLSGPVLGVAYDGTGYGTDGTAWGGEILLADYGQFERLATFRPLPLAGGELAIREVWRLALAAVEDAFDGEPPLEELALFRYLDPKRVRLVRQMLARRIESPLARGVGRWFDALGSLVLGRELSRHEGQVALEWNLVASCGDCGYYPIGLALERVPWEIDLRPLVRSVVEDLRSERPPWQISARFHHSLARATAEVVRGLAGDVGNVPVVLTGGCFQNALLTETTLRHLAPYLQVHVHSQVPPGDGGIALGQALVADTKVRSNQGGSTCA